VVQRILKHISEKWRFNTKCPQKALNVFGYERILKCLLGREGSVSHDRRTSEWVCSRSRQVLRITSHLEHYSDDKRPSSLCRAEGLIYIAALAVLQSSCMLSCIRLFIDWEWPGWFWIMPKVTGVDNGDVEVADREAQSGSTWASLALAFSAVIDATQTRKHLAASIPEGGCSVGHCVQIVSPLIYTTNSVFLSAGCIPPDIHNRFSLPDTHPRTSTHTLTHKHQLASWKASKGRPVARSCLRMSPKSAGAISAPCPGEKKYRQKKRAKVECSKLHVLAKKKCMPPRGALSQVSIQAYMHACAYWGGERGLSPGTWRGA
jgi:hypothetical protein